MRTIASLLLAAAATCTLALQGTLRQEWDRAGRTHPLSAVEFSVSMKQSNLDVLEDRFWKISTPGSEQYGKFMTFDEVNALTATPLDTSVSVSKWMEQAGAKCKTLAGDTLRCLARAQDLEKAFGTKMYKFVHKKTGRSVHKIDAEYQFPKELEGKVNFISGLNSFPMPHLAEARKMAADASTLSVVPSTIKSMYNLNGASAAGSVQAAFEFQDLTAFSSSDLSTFISNTGAKSFDVEKHYGPFQQFPPQAESTLDVQYLGAVAEGGTNYYYTTAGWMLEMTADLLSNSAYGIDVVSMSYGWSEADQCQISPGSAPCSSGGSQAFVNAVNTNFQKLGATGVTLLAATGDAGAHGRTDLSCSSGQVHPGFPAASPYITAVGATQLGDDAKAGGDAPICQNQLQCAISGSEIASSTSTGALITTGGGFSLYANRPSYQDSVVQTYLAKNGVTPPSNDFNSAGRGYPDVAALGHAYYIELDGQVQAVDGTSAACPVFAGVLSLINGHRVKNGGSKLGFANPLLYKAYASDASSFNDVTVGDNKCTQSGGQCCSTGFSASAGWDATTGLGTPNYAKLVAAIDTVLDGAPKEASLYEQLMSAVKSIFGQ